jgi:hypothetical protein
MQLGSPGEACWVLQELKHISRFPTLAGKEKKYLMVFSLPR